MAFRPGDLFEEDGGPGAHLAPGSRKSIACAYARWLAYLAGNRSDILARSTGERITPDTARAFIDHLEPGLAGTTVAIYIQHLYYAARILAPDDDWTWLRRIKTALAARATPRDRFEHLVPPWMVLDHGIELMETALALAPDPWHRREVQFRNGILISILALWPIRRRSLEALTVTSHLEVNGDKFALLLFPEDTKARRAASFAVPELIQPYVEHYLRAIRPRFPKADQHVGFWASIRGRPLTAQWIYTTFREVTKSRFGRAMSLHDARRSAATFLAIEAPEMVGIIPGLLQHTSPEVGQQHYNQARSATASRRHVEQVESRRERLRAAYRRQRRA